jgi:hypothetical protein
VYNQFNSFTIKWQAYPHQLWTPATYGAAAPETGDDCMDFALTKKHRMVQKTVCDFAQKEIAPLIQEYDCKQEIAPFVQQRMGELCILGLCLPVKYGGSSMDYLN